MGDDIGTVAALVRYDSPSGSVRCSLLCQYGYLISYNVRGLGNEVKINEIKDLFYRHMVEIFFIQETKLEVIDTKIGRGIRGNKKCGWVCRQSIGLSVFRTPLCFIEQKNKVCSIPSRPSITWDQQVVSEQLVSN